MRKNCFLCKQKIKKKKCVFPVRTRHDKDQVSFNDAYNPAANLGPHENPPFHPGFFIVKVNINDTNLVRVVSESNEFSQRRY